MNNFIELTKAFFLTGFNVNKKKKNQRSAFASVGIAGLLFFCLSFAYNLMYMTEFKMGGLPLEQYMLIVLTVDAYIVLITTLTQMQGQIFKTKDYEFLESLPVSKTVIVGSKITAVYLIGLFEDFLITIPAIVLFLIYGGSVYFAVLIFISTFFISIIPLLISSIIGALVSLLSAKAKNQTLVSTIFTLLFACIPLILIFVGGDNLLESATNIFPYFYFINEAIDPSKFYMFLIFIGIHLVSAVLVCYLIGLIYRPMNSYLGNVRFHEEYKSSNVDTDLPVDKALFKKELYMVSKNSKYGVNSFLGGVFYLLFGVLFLFFPSILGESAELGEGEAEFINLNYLFGGMTIAFAIIYNSMMTSTSASISFEGGNFQLLLAYPIEPKQVIKNKLKVAIIIPSIINIVSGTIISIIFSILYGFDISMILAFILIPISCTINIAVIGMCCGLRWPKIDYQNEMQLLKNCASVNFTMLFCALPNVLYSIIAMVFTMVMENAWVGLVLVVLLNGISTLIGLSVLRKHQLRLFNLVMTR